jgi:hypothetical protein
MPRGGRRPGGGRPKGSPNKKTLALKEALAEMGAHPEIVLAEFMLNVKLPASLRVEAAKALIPYVHSRMPTALDVGLTTMVPVEIVIEADEPHDE